VKLKTATVSLYLLAGTLFLIAALRDIFAPGFFNNSSAIPGTADIVLKFVSAAAFLALAASTGMSQGQEKKKQD
jgi:hypothetical protein